MSFLASSLSTSTRTKSFGDNGQEKKQVLSPDGWAGIKFHIFVSYSLLQRTHVIANQPHEEGSNSFWLCSRHLVLFVKVLANRRKLSLERKMNLVSTRAAGLGDDTLHILNLGLATGEGTELWRDRC